MAETSLSLLSTPDRLHLLKEAPRLPPGRGINSYAAWKHLIITLKNECIETYWFGIALKFSS
jgi:hypothetical protein